jgi:hypothetical protein
MLEENAITTSMARALVARVQRVVGVVASTVRPTAASV